MNIPGFILFQNFLTFGELTGYFHDSAMYRQRGTLLSVVALILVACVFLCGLPALDLDGEDVYTYGHGDRAEMPLYLALACNPLLAPSALLKPEPLRLLPIERLEAAVVGDQRNCELCPNTYARPAPPPPPPISL